MLQFEIKIPSQRKRADIEARLSGVLGMGTMVQVAKRMAIIQDTTKPEVQDPVLLVFAGDHGFAEDFSESEKRVWESLTPHSALNAMVSRAGLRLRFVDAGLRAPMENMVDFWLHRGSGFIPRKIKAGTRDIRHEAAMTTAECHHAIAMGAALIEREFYKGSNLIGLGDSGSGKIKSAYVLHAALLDKKVIRLMPEGKSNSKDAKILQRIVNKHPTTPDPIMNLTLFGGYETAMLVGAILQATHRQMTVVVDGDSVLTALHLSLKLYEEVANYIVLAQKRNVPIFHYLKETYNLPHIMDAELHTDCGIGVALAFPVIHHGVQLMQ
ncbi:MAG: nicotinate-nucleotide--dimethylbenzimidazole phosphoribosyltransferase [Cryomorphaceae bacterium]|nr:nicotinate-nucleotide--dimethylbenzimidazole phosphoribosyltransferase [Cryomorphaceae bacterium]